MWVCGGGCVCCDGECGGGGGGCGGRGSGGGVECMSLFPNTNPMKQRNKFRLYP